MIGSISSSAPALFARPPSTTPVGGSEDRSRAAGGALPDTAQAPAVQIVGGKNPLVAGDTAKPAEPGQPKEATEGEATTTSALQTELTAEERAQVARLRARDREVRAHEQAHAAAGGAVAGAPSYSYQTGPDGKQYAVGGEVPIRASASSGNPRQAIAQLQQVVRAALAPAQPSGQDRAVAAQAQAQIAQLQAQLAKESQAKAQAALQSANGEQKSNAAATPAGLPALPDLPETTPAAGRSSNTAAPGLARSRATPNGIGASDANPLGRGGVSALVRSAAAADGEETRNGGPIEAAPRGAGPVAAYQQTDHRAKPAAIIGRIVSLSA
jgi:hypothetical protein